MILEIDMKRLSYATIFRTIAREMVHDSSALVWAKRIRDEFGMRCLISKGLQTPHVLLKDSHKILSMMGEPLVRSCKINKLILRGDMGPNRSHYPNHGYYVNDEVALNADIFYHPDKPDDFMDSKGNRLSRAEQTLIHELGHALDERKGMLSTKPDWLKLSGWSETPKKGLRRLHIKEPGMPEVVGEWYYDPQISTFTRFYAKKNPWDDFADSFAFYVGGLLSKVPENKARYFKNLLSRV